LLQPRLVIMPHLSSTVRAVTARAAIVATVLVLVVTASARAATPLELGFADPRLSTPSTVTADARQAAQLGARWLRIPVRWREVAPAEPGAAFVATDPSDGAYRFAPIDAAVRAASDAGLKPLLLLAVAPDWAEGPGRSRRALPGTWRPDPAAFGRFVRAVAARYSGRTADAGGTLLPAIAGIQAWNEPNLAIYLYPQWRRAGRSFAAVSPGLYRGLLRAAAEAIDDVAPGLALVTAGTAPYGDLRAGGDRMAPASFVRRLLCVDRRLQRRVCGSVPPFSALAHHPYAVAGPLETPLLGDDVSLGDLRDLSRILVRARALGAVRGRPQLWVTEFGWESRPDDPSGIPRTRQARWLSQALRRMASAGVRVALWYKLRDDAPVPSTRRTVQSGVQRAAGALKPAARMFALPVDGRRNDRRSATLWALPGRSGVARWQLQRPGARGWTEIHRERVRASFPVVTRVGIPPGSRVRLIVDTTTSVAIRL